MRARRSKLATLPGASGARHETIRRGARSEDRQTELPMLKLLGGTIGFIFLVGLVVVVGILMLIF